MMEIETTNKCIYPNPIGMFDFEICSYNETLRDYIDNVLTKYYFDILKLSDNIYNMFNEINVDIDNAIIKFDMSLGKWISIYITFKLSRPYDETIWLRLTTHDCIIRINSNQIEIMITFHSYINEFINVLLKTLNEKIEKIVNMLKSIYNMLYLR